MTDQPEQTTAEVTEEYLFALLNALKKSKIKTMYGLDLNASQTPQSLTIKLQGISSYLSALSLKRQEKILSKQYSLLDAIKYSAQEQEEVQQDQHETQRNQHETQQVQKELQQAQNQLVSDSLKSSSRFGKFSIGVSIAAMVVAVISVWTSVMAMHSSSGWQAEQTPLLQNIAENTKPAEPAKYIAEHTALLKTIAENTTQPADK